MAYHIGEACTGCTACAKLCPVFAITGKSGERHTVNEKRCVECGVCGRICPKSAVQDGAGKICSQVKRGEWPMPVIKTEQCSACGICVSDCTKGALRISMPRFRGDINVYAELAEESRCVGCGICRNHCPLELIEMITPEKRVTHKPEADV